MESVTSSAAQADLEATMKKVCESHTPVLIDRSPEPNVVVISEESFKVMEEATHLLGNYSKSKDILQNIAKKESDMD